MYCTNCKQNLPDGSTFCHYCGTPLKAEAAGAVNPSYGLTPENPVYVQGIEGEKQYLRSLRSVYGQNLAWNRQGSMKAEGVSAPVDVFDGYLPTGERYSTVYMCMYGNENSRQAPAGFSYASEAEPVPAAEETIPVAPVEELPTVPVAVSEIPAAVPVTPAAAPVKFAKPVQTGNIMQLVGKVAPVAAVALLVVCIVLFGQVSGLKSQLEEASQLKEQYFSENQELQDVVEALNQTLAEQQLTIDDLQLTADEYNSMYEILTTHNVGSATYNFQATEKMMVVKMGDTGHKFTLTAYWRDGGTVSIDYSSPCATISFDKENFVKTTPMTIIPNSPGFTVATFSNSEDSNTFSMLIVVVE